ncbi:hypothetical protein Pcinc_034369 [Petrolisthes cinctipes]|uniref:Uncharacterized protein n=1 Tax=Petrolisthes cinctipes TaxID=88211 RepID=A0AAE1EQG1_PETCI|nr:hypothetical protein Pcinc_034369 [Petrolisthes cinctipes]
MRRPRVVAREAVGVLEKVKVFIARDRVFAGGGCSQTEHVSSVLDLRQRCCRCSNEYDEHPGKSEVSQDRPGKTGQGKTQVPAS